MIKVFFEVEVHDPRIMEENGKVIGDDTLEKMLLVITNAEEGIKKLKKYTDLGFTEIILTNSSPNREKLLNLIAEKLAQNLRM
jgi:hypothetical protein